MGRCEHRETRLGRSVKALLLSLALSVALPAVPQEAPTARQLLDDARNCMHVEPARALELTRRALELEPRNAEAYYVLGRYYQRAGRVGEAEGAFRRSVEIAPSYAEGWVGLGELLLSGEEPDLDSAQRAFERAWAENPRFVSALYGLAQTELASGRSERARERLIEVLKLDPNHAAAHLDLGLELYAAGDLRTARESLIRACHLTVNDPLPHFALGLVLDSLGDLENAVAAYDRALVIDPNDTAALYNKAVALESLGRAEEALEAYRLVQARDPGAPEAAARTAQLLVALGRDTEAIAKLRELLAANPNDTGARLRLANAYIARGKQREAMIQLDRVLQVDPANMSALRAMAMLAERDEDYARAAAHYRAMAEADPDDAGHRQALIRTLVKAGAAEEALALAREGATAPTDYVARQLLIQTLSSAGRRTEAFDEAQALLRLFPEDVATLSFVASGLEERNLIGEALALYRRATELSPDDSSLAFRHARALESAGRIEEALAVYRQVLAKAPGAGPAHEGVLRCLEALGESTDLAQALAARAADEPSDYGLSLRTGQALRDAGSATEAAPFAARALVTAVTAEQESAALDLVLSLADHQAMETELKRAYGAAPTTRTALALARLLGRSGAGRRWAFTAIELAQGRPDQTAAAIEALVDGGHLSDAAVEADKLVRAEPRSPSARVAAGRIYEMLGDTRTATDHYRTAIREDPACTRAREALDRLGG